jgi:hypothetical protein
MAAFEQATGDTGDYRIGFFVPLQNGMFQLAWLHEVSPEKT